MTQTAHESVEEKVTERIPKTEMPCKTSENSSRADEAVTETKTEVNSLRAEIDALEERRDKVTEQSCAQSLSFMYSYTVVCLIDQNTLK